MSDIPKDLRARAVEAAAGELRSTHWDGNGCGTFGAGGCSRCYGPSPADAEEVVGHVLDAVLPLVAEHYETQRQDDPCTHESCSGDEGPVAELGSAHVVRWRCDGCGTIVYSDAALAQVRAQLRDAQAEIDTWRVRGDRHQRDCEIATRQLAEARRQWEDLRDERARLWPMAQVLPTVQAQHDWAVAELAEARATIGKAREVAERYTCDHTGFDDVVAALRGDR